ACGNYLCTAGVCSTSCTNDTQCAATAYCVTASSTCAAKKATGLACAAANECTSGVCADGVCCSTTCTGFCQACSAAKKGAGADGTCGFIVAGADPDNECTAAAVSTCGLDGTCDGAGACRKYVSGTVCVFASCSAGTQTTQGTCNGTGTCGGSVMS